MFNKTIVENHDNSVRFPNTVNVHEHRAPTDKSVELLNEMEDKALENVVLKISDTIVMLLSFLKSILLTGTNFQNLLNKVIIKIDAW